MAQSWLTSVKADLKKKKAAAARVTLGCMNRGIKSRDQEGIILPDPKVRFWNQRQA